MTDLSSPGSAGFGLFRVDSSTGEVFYDPQGNGGGFAPGVTLTGIRGVLRDSEGRLWVGDLASVEVTRVADQPTYASDGMTLTQEKVGIGSWGTWLSNATKHTVRADLTRNIGEAGVVFEGGGGLTGLIMWVVDNTIHYRCGRGNQDVANPDVGYLTAPAPTGSFVVEVSADCTTAPGNAAMYIDGVLVDTTTFNVNLLSGNNLSGVGTIGGADSANAGAYSDWLGGISVKLFNGQTTSDVA